MTRTARFLASLIVVSLSAPFLFGQNQYEDLRKVAATLTAEQVAELRPQANAGDARAQTLLGVAFQDGRVVTQNEELAAKWLRKAADQGFPPAQNMMGAAYELGIGVPQDREQALNWYKQSARRGYPAALFNVGNFYERDGIDQDPYRAYAWWIVAAELGDPTARDGLMRFNVETSARYPMLAWIAGSMFLEGTEVPQNVTLGLKWLEIASAKNEPRAKLRLAEMYLRGHIVPKDSARGLMLLSSVAKEYSSAALLLGDVYASDEFVRHDYGQASKWYKFALTPETPEGFTRLAGLYVAGSGVDRDRMTGAMYYVIATNFGEPVANKKLVELQLTEDETKKAKDMATKWLHDPKHGAIFRAIPRHDSKKK